MKQAKKIINNPKNVVVELLEGLVEAYHGKIKKLSSVQALVKTNIPKGNTAAHLRSVRCVRLASNNASPIETQMRDTKWERRKKSPPGAAETQFEAAAARKRKRANTPIRGSRMEGFATLGLLVKK